MSNIRETILIFMVDISFNLSKLDSESNYSNQIPFLILNLWLLYLPYKRIPITQVMQYNDDGDKTFS